MIIGEIATKPLLVEEIAHDCQRSIDIGGQIGKSRRDTLSQLVQAILVVPDIEIGVLRLGDEQRR